MMSTITAQKAIWDVFVSVKAYDKKLKRHIDILDSVTFHLTKETRC